MAHVSTTDRVVPTPVGGASSTPYLEWGPVLAGAIGAAAISFLLLTFGSGIGLSATSARQGSGLSVGTLAILGAIWMVLVQVGSYAGGGYLAGRLLTGWAQPGENDFRHGAHGFAVWAVGVLLTALVVGATAATGIGAASTIAGGAAAGVSAKATEQLATGAAEYGADYLFRPAPGAAAGGAPGGAAPGAGAATPVPAETRAEVARIMVSSLGSGAVAPRDREYLARLVAARSGLPQADAEKRVDEAFSYAREAEARAREAADKARRAAALTAFLTAAALLAGCAAACAGATLGARHRQAGTTARFWRGERFW